MRLDRAMGIAIAALAAPLRAQPVPADLNQFGLICFCNSRIATPHRLIALDNNGRVLFATRNGATREQLRAADAAVTESQVQMLKDWDLLTEHNKVLRTAIPVLEPTRIASLRTRLGLVADKVMPAIELNVRAIQRDLAKRGKAPWTYSVLFSYVLDGLLWDHPAIAAKLPSTDITVEHPYWAGTFWAVYPKQDTMPGTNWGRHGDASMRFMWSTPTNDAVQALISSPQTKAWWDALQKGQRPPSPLFGDVNLDPIVIDERTNDEIARNASAIVSAVAPRLAQTDLASLLPEATESQRLLIATHEFIWLLLGRLVERNHIPIPKAVAAGADSPTSLAPFVVAVLNRHKALTLYRPDGAASRDHRLVG